MTLPKKVLAIHDLSCVGRCSLSVILPALSVLGAQVCPLPTALLSTHSAFSDFTFLDLTGEMESIFSHFQKLSLHFDCVYSGFMGSEAQMERVSAIFVACRAPVLKIVDPVMGDHGKLYKTITPKMQEQMGELTAHADVITPNLTEACLLLGEPYEEELGRDKIREYLLRLCEKGPKAAIITGVATEKQLVNYAYSVEDKQFLEISAPLLPKRYPGTGDLFTAVLTGYLLQGGSLQLALEKATAFLSKVIERTIEADTPIREGVLLESCLHLL